jgi:ADP-ribosyl-[dinitrogen reductase] hydrolase
MNEDDRCQGCIFGAWLGDATGSVLEFKGRPSESALSEAFELNGGGLHRLGPGQITDDGELTCCLLQGLVQGSSKLDLNAIASMYGKWIQSKPFDLGGTLRKSFPKACNMKSHQAEMLRRGSKLSATSQSNGCLMRISPLAVWCRNLPLESIITAVKEEVGLSHPNETVQNACCFYAIAIKFLLKTGDRALAYTNTKEFFNNSISEEFKEWIEMIENGQNLLIHKPAGWSKIAFVYGFRYLINGFGYHEALYSIMKGGGDTDTNACIIGGLIGAADGLSTLPQDKVYKMVAWNPKKGGIKRPDWLRVNYCSPLIGTLISMSPNTLEVIGGTFSYPINK